MTTNNQLVGQFHAAFGVAEPKVPTVPHEFVRDLRMSLINEEANEVYEAIEEGNLANIAKELADLLVVTYGTARAFGIDIDPVFQAVHASNMSKLDANGNVIRREDGKILKSDQYRPADVQPVLDKQTQPSKFHSLL